MENAQDPQPQVVVVGGSLVGLSAAMFLAWHGVRVAVVERHAGSSPHPRAIGFTPRTLELFRAVGLGDDVPQAPPGHRLRRVTVESLAGTWHAEAQWTPATQESARVEYSPCSGAAIAQDRLEPILRQHALKLGAQLHASTDMVRFEEEEEEDGGVVLVVHLRRRTDGSEYTLRAPYLIAADGSASTIRSTLQIGRQGVGHLRVVRSVLFTALGLDAYLDRGISQFNVRQPGFDAFLTTYRDGRWVLMFEDDQERDDATLRACIVRAIGRDDIEPTIITTGRWELNGLIADTFTSPAGGRVFLAGDAAHALPPNRAGFGANTGIEDVHNLAWKLASVLKGTSAPALLATYDAERRPVAWLRHDQIFARPDYKGYLPAGATPAALIDDLALEFGHIYRSTAVLCADADADAVAALPPAALPDVWAGQPGTRAPHLWCRRASDGQRVSTLDLWQRVWVVVACSATWAAAAAAAAARLRLDARAVIVGVDVTTDDPADAIPKAFGMTSAGAAVVRPDGYIGWRSPAELADPADTLTAVLASLAHA